MLMDTIKMVNTAKVVKSDGVTKYVGAALYDIAGSTAVKPTNAAILMRFVAVRAFTIEQNFTGSTASCTYGSTAGINYAIQRNGALIGNLYWPANTAAGTFNATEVSTHSFNIGDVLTVVTPVTADSVHDELAFTFSATAI